MPDSHADTIRDFYLAFARKDGDAMAAAYAPDVHFRDPAFGDLHGEEPGAMWRMLTGRSEDLEIELVDHDDSSAHWLAHYTFSTGRHVDNDVRASFKFNDAGQDQRAHRRLRLLRLGAPGARPGRPAAGLDADHQGRRAQEGERSAGRVHGAVAQVDDPAAEAPLVQQLEP